MCPDAYCIRVIFIFWYFSLLYMYGFLLFSLTPVLSCRWCWSSILPLWVIGWVFSSLWWWYRWCKYQWMQFWLHGSDTIDRASMTIQMEMWLVLTHSDWELIENLTQYNEATTAISWNLSLWPVHDSCMVVQCCNHSDVYMYLIHLFLWYIHERLGCDYQKSAIPDIDNVVHCSVSVGMKLSIVRL